MAIANRGFASMNPDTRRRIASLGGKSAHAKGLAHKWTAEEAREAGRKGGAATQRRREPTIETTALERKRGEGITEAEIEEESGKRKRNAAN